MKDYIEISKAFNDHAIKIIEETVDIYINCILDNIHVDNIENNETNEIMKLMDTIPIMDAKILDGDIKIKYNDYVTINFSKFQRQISRDIKLKKILD